MALRQDLFRGVTAFRHEPRHYCAYTNGKSFGVLGATGLRPKGPHRFTAAGLAAPATTDVAAGGDGGGGGGSSAGGGDSGGGSGSGGGSDGEDSMPSLSHDIQPHVGCILHFESSLFAMWQAKYCAMAMRHMADDGAIDRIKSQTPFAFYRESLAAAVAMLRAASADDDDDDDDDDDGPSLQATVMAKAIKLWSRWKLPPDGLPDPPPPGHPPIVLDGKGLTLLQPLDPRQ